MKVSVVIPSYNARDGLAGCLRSLAGQRLDAGDDLEVVVVDDGSSDGTGAMVAGQPLDVDYVYKPRTATSGRSAARNTGIDRATGDLVVMLDPDHVFGAELVAEHIRYHRIRDDVVVLGPRVRAGTGPERDSRAIVLGRTSDNLNNLATCWHYMFTCNVSVRREHLLAAGGFDEGFVGWGLEDSELGYRLRRRGLAFAYNPDAVIHNQQKLVLDARMHADWRRNMAHFAAVHPAPEVALQWHLDDTFDPSLRVDWIARYVQFEYAARALHGRIPGPREFTVLDTGTDEDILGRLPALAAAGDTVVIDRAADPRLCAAVQCVDTPHELLYYRRPADADLGEWSWLR